MMVLLPMATLLMLQVTLPCLLLLRPRSWRFLQAKMLLLLLPMMEVVLMPQVMLLLRRKL